MNYLSLTVWPLVMVCAAYEAKHTIETRTLSAFTG